MLNGSAASVNGHHAVTDQANDGSPSKSSRAARSNYKVIYDPALDKSPTKKSKEAQRRFDGIQKVSYGDA